MRGEASKKRPQRWRLASGRGVSTRAAFSAIPLNSPGVQAHTVSILDNAPLAATAIPMATASDPSASSETSTTSFEPVVLYSATSLPPAFSINALTAPDRSDGLLTSPFTPEWEIRCIRDEQRHTSPPCFEG